MPEYTIFPYSSAPRVPFKFDGRILFTSERFELIHLTLRPGEEMEPHVQPVDVVFYILQGEGTLSVGNEITGITAGTTIHVKAGVTRAWHNRGQHPLNILVSKLLSPQ